MRLLARSWLARGKFCSSGENRINAHGKKERRMHHPLAWLVLLSAILTTHAVRAADPHPFPGDSEHLWNRLHEQLYVRIQKDGSRYVHENLDANFTPRADFLIKGDSHRQAIALL